MAGLFDNLLNLVFPTHCRTCGKESEEIICAHCRSSLRPIEPPICRICGIPLVAGMGEVCKGCEFEQPPFLLCRSAFYYENALREAIKSFKFDDRIELAPYLFNAAGDYFRRNEFLFSADCLVPVPSNPVFFRNRKYDPSLILSKWISKSLDLPINECLERTREVLPQYELDYESRWENVREAFTVRQDSEINGKSILLVDDIITSGATVFDCSRALVGAGASKIFVFTLTRSKWKRKDTYEKGS